MFEPVITVPPAPAPTQPVSLELLPGDVNVRTVVTFPSPEPLLGTAPKGISDA